MEVLKMSLSASIFILAIIIIRILTLHRLPKRMFLVLWVVAVCRLLIPLSVSSRFSIFTFANILKMHFSAMNTTDIGMVPINIGTATETINTSLAKTASGSISPFMVVWLIGLSVCALFFLYTHLRWLREYKTALPVDNGFVKTWQRSHQIRRKVEIRQSDIITTPLVYGIFRPVILFPKGTDWTDEKRLQYILIHELVHIRRFDTLIKLLLVAAVCVHWFNPLVWGMYLLANRDIELSCDEAVVRTFGETMKSTYALTLIGLEEKRSSITPFVNDFSKNAIEERIVSIMKMKKISIISLAIAIVIVLSVTVVFATTAKSNKGNIDALSLTEGPTPTPTVVAATSSSKASTERSAKIESDTPSAEPISEKALSEYWKIGALNVNGVPYLPLVDTAEHLGYKVNIVSKNIDPENNPKHQNIVEYNYELIKDGKSLGIASLDVSDGRVVESMLDGIYCNTHDKTTHTSIVLQKNTIYMPAQFFKEALDTANKLP